MRSYIKIYGPPVLKAIRALEKIAIDKTEVCIMDTQIVDLPMPGAGGESSTVQAYFADIGAEIPFQRCSTIISKSGEKLGEYNFFFEWLKDPSLDEMNQLIEKIDEALTPLGCRYTLITK